MVCMCIKPTHSYGCSRQVNLSAFEIQAEIITDLLRPAASGLSLAVTPEEGVAVQGLSREVIGEAMERRRLLGTCLFYTSDAAAD